MGRRIVALLAESATLRLAAEGESPQVVIDFSSPAGTRAAIEMSRSMKIPLVIGTTGLAAGDHAAIDAAATEIAVLQAPNMSLGVALLAKLAMQASIAMGPDIDVEILESHHRFKKDSPSGTASALADTIERARRNRPPIHSTRLGDEIGRHTIYLAALGERVELTHVATDRDVFARGALRAAQWIVRQKPGRYTMGDLLELE
jgi:4-hydroxy-tetrahydrodipicolinate reductase